ncbi:MAG: YbjN domain-containing protein [Treponema sp.]|jgi:hypothetical protein|nr:YbjN domain-containing protein [Treponema sp.]
MENRIERYLIDMMYTYRQVEQNLWLIDDEEHGLCDVAVALAEPLVIIRVAVMDIPKGDTLEFYTKLLEFNARELVHGAYALEDGKVVLIDTLEYDTMDYREFRATLDAFSLALTQHYPILSKYRR